MGTVSDGDIRRGILNGLTLNDKIANIIHRKPIVSKSHYGRTYDRNLMLKYKIRILPKVNNKGQVIDLVKLDKLENLNLNNSVIFMVGGKGKRLMPYTSNIPKPMLKIKGKPILEHLVEKVKSEGFTNITFITNHLHKIIEKYFGNGKNWNLSIKYIRESKPLGTAGGLAYFKSKNNLPVIVSNGDVLTDASYFEILNFHLKNKNLVTVGVKEHKISNPFCVVKITKNKIVYIREKPQSASYISAGVYDFNKNILKLIKKKKFLDMTSLLNNLFEKKIKISAYPIHEQWLDLGLKSQYDRLRKVAKKNKKI